MKMFSIFYKCLVTLTIISYVYGNETIDEKDLAECTKLRTHTEEYTARFPITDKHYKGNNIFLTFYIKSASDASITVSSATGQTANKPETYEVILSTKSLIPSQIRKLGHNILAKHFGKDTLSPNEWRPFWIQLSPEGSIRVGNDEAGNSTFLSWKRDQRMLIDKFESASYKNSINHFGLTSHGDATVDWAFRCPKNHSKDLTQCVKLRTTKYDYNAAFSINDYIQKGGIIFLPFYVKASRDAHIVLSPSWKPTGGGEPSYEIILGGWSNTGAGIRSTRGGSENAQHSERDMISPDEWRPFWIRVSPNGLIEVGKEIGAPPFMSWKPKLPVDDYAVASYDNGIVNWAIECPEREIHSESEYVCIV